MRKLIRLLFFIGLVVFLLGLAGGLGGGIYVYTRLTRDLPQIERISDYRPKAVTNVLAADGSLIAELYDERRYPVAFEKIPDTVADAFLAAEDANFYNHPGIDVVSIIRAMWVNFRNKKTKQGASTITQQIVKSLLLTREKTYERKAKEAILAYRLEKALSKKDILTIYLNEIFLGSGAYGVKAAAKVHFRKELEELSIAEAAYLGGLPQRPSELTRPENRELAMRRQRYVLSQMRKNEMITEEELEAAQKEELVIYPPGEKTIFAVPYFSRHVGQELKEIFRDKIEGDLNATNPGGFVVRTTADVVAHKMAEEALTRGLREIDKRQGWRGPIGEVEKENWEEYISQAVDKVGVELVEDEVYEGLVVKVNRKRGVAVVRVGGFVGALLLKGKTNAWAKKLVQKERDIRWIELSRLIRPGHILEVSLAPVKKGKKRSSDPKKQRFVLNQTPELESAVVLSNVLTGEVPVIVGGYDYKRSQFNRATQALLQPGSGFKPFIYLAAIDDLAYTPASIVPDSPISMIAGDGTLWSPQNYDRKFLGPITLREALQRSRNVVSVYLLKKLGVDSAIRVAKQLGISTEIPRIMSISLGAAEVKVLDIVRAYGAFAAGGWLADSLIIKSITNRDGEVIYEQRPRQEQVLSESSAFIMANMMKGVVERGTAQRIRALKRPVAGKTGTTNDQMDAWFIGYTPEWVAGVWVGYDKKRTIGRFETGGKAAAPIFLYFMQDFLADKPALDFDIPDGVIPVAINPKTGRLAGEYDESAFMEYFKSGTEPRYGDSDLAIPKDYLSNEEF